MPMSLNALQISLIHTSNPGKGQSHAAALVGAVSPCALESQGRWPAPGSKTQCSLSHSCRGCSLAHTALAALQLSGSQAIMCHDRALPFAFAGGATEALPCRALHSSGRASSQLEHLSLSTCRVAMRCRLTANCWVAPERGGLPWLHTQMHAAIVSRQAVLTASAMPPYGAQSQGRNLTMSPMLHAHKHPRHTPLP